MITKNILVLEDEKDVADATRDAFHQYNITVLGNLIDFHGHLFEEPGAHAYDYVWIDLALDLGTFPLNIYKNVIPKMFTAPTTEVSGIQLFGFDYFTRVIWPDERFTNTRTTKFILLTGYASMIEREQLLAAFPGVRIIKKHGDGAYDELKSTIV